MIQVKIANLSSIRITIITLFTLFFSLAFGDEQSSRLMDERDIFKQAHVYHILFQDRLSAEESLAQLQATPENQIFSAFKITAKAKSIDIGSAKDGGDLGILTNNGTMPNDFMSAVFALPPHQLSRVIQTTFGWHLIYVQSSSEEPIKSICEKSLNESIKHAQPEDEDAIKLTRISYTEGATLHPAVLDVIGNNWTSPLTDPDGNLYYFLAQSAQGKSDSMLVTQHIEYKHAKHYDAGCMRSSREEFIVDCKAPLITWHTDSRISYELRGGTGRVVYKFPPGSKTPISVAPQGDFLMRLYKLACSPHGTY